MKAMTGIAVLIAFASISLGQTPSVPAEKPKASSLISAMFKRYSEANSLNGTIRLTQQARGQSIVLETILAYERPGKILLAQNRTGSDPKSVMLVSDGKIYSYSQPKQFGIDPPRLAAKAIVDGRPLTMEEMYLMQRSNLPDPSPVLGAALAFPADLRTFASQLIRYTYRGKVKVKGMDVEAISGMWRERHDAGASGDFELYLSEAGDIVRYVLKQNYAVPGAAAGAGSQSIQVLSVWDADLKVNVAIDPKLFRVH